MDSVTGVASEQEIIIFEKIPSVALDHSHSSFALDNKESLVKVNFVRLLRGDVKHVVKDDFLFGYFINGGNVAIIQCGDFDFRFDIC